MVDAKAIKEANRKAFLDVFPQLTNEVLDELRKYNMPEDAYEWTKQVRYKLYVNTARCTYWSLFSILELGVQRSRW